MASNNFGYAHLLLFRCKQCNGPVGVPVMGQARNLEEIDSETYIVECRCGWSESLLGAEALAHWVLAWGEGKAVRDLTPGTDEVGFTN
jgi:hypothetical protein